jgi:hypothetical protein
VRLVMHFKNVDHDMMRGQPSMELLVNTSSIQLVGQQPQRSCIFRMFVGQCVFFMASRNQL